MHMPFGDAQRGSWHKVTQQVRPLACPCMHTKLASWAVNTEVLFAEETAEDMQRDNGEEKSAGAQRLERAGHA